ncbi:LysR family transcriptional regulator [Isoptericola sp. NEAU-Y5]|uniref:LysR family transcriptional regulator n=1 Tax=Isoptericola luteus TaxID=2879484 RepID=A0ABS7ZM12_9MICO|nr:LysR substrate-binding domain-containing protein [Isoptericola sp. NEAU-Y5]MCA5894919.1 LysR family transcriptional regulator [Isoptericola sp. NEAU-Y5]
MSPTTGDLRDLPPRDLPWSGLRALVALAEHGTMTSAAASLGFTTGAVSHQLSALSRALGTEVVRAHGRGVVLTDAGEALTERADALIAAQRHAVDAARAATGDAAGTVRLGAFATVAASLLPRLVAELAHQYPHVTLEGFELTVDDVSAAVRRGDVDLGLGLDYPRAPIPRLAGTVLRPLRTERFALVSSPTTDLPDRLHLADVAHLSWILPPAGTHYGAAVRGACRAAGFEPRAAHEVNDTSTTLALVAQGLGVALATPVMRGLRPGTDLFTSTLRDVVEREIVLLEPSSAPRRTAVDVVAHVIERVVHTTHVTP